MTFEEFKGFLRLSEMLRREYGCTEIRLSFTVSSSQIVDNALLQVSGKEPTIDHVAHRLWKYIHEELGYDERHLKAAYECGRRDAYSNPNAGFDAQRIADMVPKEWTGQLVVHK